MPRPPSVRPLPEPERREALGEYLEVLERDPDLAHFRSLVPAGPQRQLALLAALERAVFRGNGTVCPPAGVRSPSSTFASTHAMPPCARVRPLS